MSWTIKVLIVESVIPLTFRLALSFHPFYSSVEACVLWNFAIIIFISLLHKIKKRKKFSKFPFLNREYEIKIENCEVEYEMTK